MSLQFITGNSGNGKTKYLFNRIVKEAKANPRDNYLVIVPEQFTMQTQRPDYLKLETDFEHDIREDLDMFRKRYLETIAEDPEPPVWKALDQFEMTFSQ